MELFDWQRARLREIHAGRGPADYAPGRPDVTVLLYYWAADPRPDDFLSFECSLRETWLHCGLLRTTIVSNEPFPFLMKFAESFAPLVQVDVEPSLVPGDIVTMSADMNSRLADRFSTPWVLIVQNDGFPLRSGLDEFIGEWDFIGAPYVRDKWWTNLVSSMTNAHVMNGGFSLRSRRICERAAEAWKNRYSKWPAISRRISEDIFYTETLPLRSRDYRRMVRFPSARTAARFSYDAIVPFPSGDPRPFGFHGRKAFEVLAG